MGAGERVWEQKRRCGSRRGGEGAGERMRNQVEGELFLRRKCERRGESREGGVQSWGNGEWVTGKVKCEKTVGVWEGER